MSLDFPRLRRRLLAWFDQHQRRLPWRENRDPYRIWISEVMLQQTTVPAVLPYFERFISAFPTLADLAQAPEQEVLRIWEGLGYYRRARHLHQAAKILVKEHRKALPNDSEVWSQLPGVGRYILGAVLSQAFDRRLPIVEANSLRVICRLFAFVNDPRSALGRKWLWTTAEEMLPFKRVGDYNQALMELGAIVCTPKSPKCLHCPVNTMCLAKTRGLQKRIPRKPRGHVVSKVREVALAIFKGQRLLLVQRPSDASRWASMWELPHGPMLPGESQHVSARRLLQSLTGLRAEIGNPIATIHHGVTRFRITMTCLEAKYGTGRFCSGFYSRGRWLTPRQMALLPMSNPQRQLIRALTSQNNSCARRNRIALGPK